ncbi:exostosin domain-containing protein [Lacinutrix chionoecetis]
MLKIFTDQQFLNETHRREVFPLLFDLHFLKSKTLSSYFEITPTVEACDIVVFPIDYSSFLKHKIAFKNLLKQAKANKKLIWIYTAGDFGFTNYIQNSYTFRLGGFSSTLDQSSFIMPSFINDPYIILKRDFALVEKETKPTIGFVGHAQSGVVKYVKEGVNHFKLNVKRSLSKVLADKQKFYPSSIKRAAYLNLLNKSQKLQTHFILRNNYRAGSETEKSKEKTTQEFYTNMFNNGYTFCSRGVGNFSVRFYETLAMGRIPVLLNTDCKLPLEDEIDWKEHCIIIEEKEAKNMPEIIVKFHDAKTEATFLDLQKSNRKLWETKLKRDQYFISIHNKFMDKTQKHV